MTVDGDEADEIESSLHHKAPQVWNKVPRCPSRRDPGEEATAALHAEGGTLSDRSAETTMPVK
jgi:hypothetical protein